MGRTVYLVILILVINQTKVTTKMRQQNTTADILYTKLLTSTIHNHQFCADHIDNHSSNLLNRTWTSSTETTSDNDTQLNLTNVTPPLVLPEQHLVSTKVKDAVLEVINCGFLPVICLFGIVGNIMSMVVLYNQGFNERTNIILTGLSFSDMVFLVTTLMRKVVCLVDKVDKAAALDWNVIMRARVLALNITFGRLSGLLTLLIAIERFIAVYFPLKAHYLLTPHRVKLAVGIIYFLIFSAMAPLFRVYELIYIYSKEQGRMMPYAKYTQFYISNLKFYKVYENTVLNIAFRYVPMLLVCILTSLIIYRIKKSSSWRKTSSTSIATAQSDRVTPMLLLVTVIYVLCIIPGTVVTTLRFFINGFNHFGMYCNMFYLLGAIIVLLEAVNSSVNFVVYMVMSKKFAATYKRIFMCRSRQDQYNNRSANQKTAIRTVSTTAM